MRRLALVLGGLAAIVLLLVLGLASALRAPRLAVPQTRSWQFEDVTLVEPGLPARPGRTLRVVDGRIASVGAAETAGAPASRLPEAGDLAGRFVAPGLIDMHVHYPPALAAGNAELWSLLLLAHGVTSVRETGSIDGSIFAVRRAIRDGAFPGPRIFACGGMLDGDPPSFPSNRVVRNAAEARAAVEEQVARGADCIKAYNMLGAEALAAIREAAERAGVPVIGHAPHAVPFEKVRLADLQHGTGVVIVDCSKIGRLDFRAEDWASVDAARIAHAAHVSLAQGIAHTPTLANSRLRRLLVDEDAARERRDADSGLRHLPSFWPVVWRAIWSPPFAPGDAEGETLYERFRERQAAMAAGLHRAGVRVHAGTDTLMPYVAPGSSLHAELAELVRAGLRQEEVWELATRQAGAWLGEPGLGTLAVGAPADLVFLRADPRGRLETLAEIDAVLADGRLYRRADFDAALERFDAHFQGGLYESVMGLAARLLAGRFAADG